MSVDPLRHLSVFSPHAFGAKRVDVVGCGATGSRIALLLAKLGVENIHCWDFDTVEEHNVANQIFGNGDVGLLKTGALARILKTQCGVDVTAHAEKVTGNGRVYALNPNKPGHIRAWEETLYTDSEAEVSACGASISVGPTAEIISGLAVWQMIRWFGIEQGGEDVLDNETIFSLRPMLTISRQF